MKQLIKLKNSAALGGSSLSQILASDLLEEIINTNNIDCDYMKVKHRLFSNEKIYKLEELYNKLKKYGVVFEKNYIEAGSAPSKCPLCNATASSFQVFN